MLCIAVLPVPVHFCTTARDQNPRFTIASRAFTHPLSCGAVLTFETGWENVQYAVFEAHLDPNRISPKQPTRWSVPFEMNFSIGWEGLSGTRGHQRGWSSDWSMREGRWEGCGILLLRIWGKGGKGFTEKEFGEDLTTDQNADFCQE